MTAKNVESTGAVTADAITSITSIMHVHCQVHFHGLVRAA
jgi:hypothetical protein